MIIYCVVAMCLPFSSIILFISFSFSFSFSFCTQTTTTTTTTTQLFGFCTPGSKLGRETKFKMLSKFDSEELPESDDEW